MTAMWARRVLSLFASPATRGSWSTIAELHAARARRRENATRVERIVTAIQCENESQQMRPATVERRRSA